MLAAGFLRAAANAAALGRLIGLEPLVQGLVGHFQGTANRRLDLRVGLLLPDRAELLGQFVKRLQPRLVPGPRT